MDDFPPIDVRGKYAPTSGIILRWRCSNKRFRMEEITGANQDEARRLGDGLMIIKPYNPKYLNYRSNKKTNAAYSTGVISHQSLDMPTQIEVQMK